MRRTDEQIEEATRRAEEFDPSEAKVEDISDLRAIAEAADALRADGTRLLEAVDHARTKGRSWNRIAIPLGVSRQAARERFADQVKARE